MNYTTISKGLQEFKAYLNGMERLDKSLCVREICNKGYIFPVEFYNFISGKKRFHWFIIKIIHEVTGHEFFDKNDPAVKPIGSYYGRYKH